MWTGYALRLSLTPTLTLALTLALTLTKALTLTRYALSQTTGLGRLYLVHVHGSLFHDSPGFKAGRGAITWHSQVTNAQCPMPNAQCPMPSAQCPMPNA